MVNSNRVFQVRSRLRRDAYTLKLNKGESISSGKKGAIIGHLNRCCDNNLGRKKLLAWLFFYEDVPPLVPVSSKKLKDGHWLALDKWIDADPDENWEPSEDFKVDCGLVLKVAISASYAKAEEYESVGEKDHTVKSTIALGGTYAKE